VKRYLLALVFLVALGAPRAAEAYSFTCNNIVAAAQSGDDRLLYSAVGYGIGVVDFLAGLQCFVQNPYCTCLANLVSNRPGDFGEAYGQEVTACINRGEGNTPGFGPALRAARQFCPW